MDVTAVLFRTLSVFKKDVAVYDILSCHHDSLRALYIPARASRMLLECQTQAAKPPG